MQVLFLRPSVSISSTRHKSWRELKEYNEKTRAAVLLYLTSYANDTFLWVALVCQNLKNIPRVDTLTELREFPPGLDSLYDRMLNRICHLKRAEHCRRTLASITLSYRPITLNKLVALTELEDMSDDLESVRYIISLCGSFLTI